VEWNTSEPTLRMLQVPELKRAMGFGSAYLMQRGTRREQIKLLGNAVCPPVVDAIVRALCVREGEHIVTGSANASRRIQGTVQVAA
jgi:DNA (cytosine-5)-methyltransferase 1